MFMMMTESGSGLSAWILGSVLISSIGLLAYRAIYNIYFHPLSRFPGPKSLAASWVHYFIYKSTGRMPFIVKTLHDEYGPVVRTGPNELSFISGQAWRDIYGQKPSLPQNRRDPYSYTDPSTDEFMRHSIMMASDKDHARQRSQLAHAFSTRALQEQQSLISGHIDRFIDQLRNRAGKEPQDIAAWFIWITFDIIGDLAFGEPFGCVVNARHHPWIQAVYQASKIATIMAGLRRFGLNVGKLIPKILLKPRLDMINFCRKRLDNRIALGTTADRNDFMSFMLRETKEGDPVMTIEELYATAEVVVVAGSETTATTLAGMTFLLLSQRPDWLVKLVASIRTTFDTDSIDEMNFQTVSSKSPLLIATIAETLRIYPPVSSSHPRLIEVPNRTVDNEVIPVGTAVGVYQWAANHSSQNWYRPDDFLPERWLPISQEDEDSVFAKGIANDRKDSMNVFSLGPRGCLGRHLAEVEMRLIFARVLWNFDIELVESQQDWMKTQVAHLTWEKGPLMVRLKPAQKT